jgi:hypothetical protein
LTSMIEVVEQTLLEEDISYKPMPQDAHSFAIRFQGLQGEWLSVAIVREEAQEFVFYSVAPQFVDEERRWAVVEYLMRANYGLSIGNFEMDFDDGEVRFRTGIDVEGDRLSPALLKSLIYSNWVTMDRYLLGLQAVMADELSPSDAIEQAEAPDEE